jgi:hypothetical protein
MPRREGAAQAIAAARQRSVAKAIDIARDAATRNGRHAVLARDVAGAIRVAKGKAWWPRVLNPDQPAREGDYFWFAVTGER